MKYIIFYKTSRTICPKCGGQIRTCRSDDVILNCIDCNSYFRAIGNGNSESELEFEEIEIG